MPVSIKELVRVKGWPASMGSKLTDKAPADADAPAVARLREAGAIVFAQSTSSEYRPQGRDRFAAATASRAIRGILERTPGGSSGGAGAAVAAGLGPLAIGTDGGGSVRIPSSFNGLVGLKATFGRVPAWPPSLTGDLANTGPMARTALDCALMMNAIARPDARDAYALPEDDTDYAKKIDGKLKKLKVAFVLRFGDHPLDIEVAAMVTKAARRVREARLQGRGGRRPPFPYADAGRAFVIHWLTALQRLLQLYPESRHGEFDPNLLAGAKARAALFAAGRGRCPGDAARAGDRLEPVLREVRPAADARPSPCSPSRSAKNLPRRARTARPTRCGRPTPRSST